MTGQKKELPLETRKFASLDKYPFHKRLVIGFIGFSLYALIMIIGKTIRFEVEGWKDLGIDGWENFEAAYARRPAIINALWHNRIFLTTYFWRKDEVAVMISQSFDGEYISRTAQRCGYGVVRGSSTRGGSRALSEMIKLVNEKVWVAFTVDGPKGPRYKAKQGPVIVAKKTGTPVIPVSVEAKKCWTLNTWDKLQIPKPFTRARVFVGEPVFVSKDSDEKAVEKKLKEVQRKLDELVLIGKQWQQSKN